MPVYEESYRSWEGILKQHPRTWWIIARTGIRLLWKKSMIIFLIFAYIPFFVRAVQIYIVTQLELKVQLDQAMKPFKINPEFFFQFIWAQMFFLVLVLIFSGAGIIANDKKFKALSIYFSKPVGLWDYLFGKWLILFFYGSLVTMIPAIILFLTRVFLSKDSAFFNNYFWIPLSIISVVILITGVLGMLILALSAACRGTRSAAIFFFTIYIVPDILGQIITKIPEIKLVSLSADFKQTGSLLFGIKLPYTFPFWLSILVLAVAAALSILTIRLKVKPTEVVK